MAASGSPGKKSKLAAFLRGADAAAASPPTRTQAPLSVAPLAPAGADAGRQVAARGRRRRGPPGSGARRHRGGRMSSMDVLLRDPANAEALGELGITVPAPPPGAAHAASAAANSNTTTTTTPGVLPLPVNLESKPALSARAQAAAATRRRNRANRGHGSRMSSMDVVLRDPANAKALGELGIKVPKPEPTPAVTAFTTDVAPLPQPVAAPATGRRGKRRARRGHGARMSSMDQLLNDPSNAAAFKDMGIKVPDDQQQQVPVPLPLSSATDVSAKQKPRRKSRLNDFLKSSSSDGSSSGSSSAAAKSTSKLSSFLATHSSSSSSSSSSSLSSSSSSPATSSSSPRGNSLKPQRRPSWRLRGKQATASLRSLQRHLGQDSPGHRRGSGGSSNGGSSVGSRAGFGAGAAAMLLNDDAAFDMALAPHLVKQKCLKQEKLAAHEVEALVSRATTILRAEPNVLELDAPVTVCGDIHGQFFDLCHLFEVGGAISDGKRYLFLGDYVDRGMFSCEVMLYLLALKVRYPDRIWLLRGNHECRTVSSYFGFRDECDAKYGLAVYNQFMGSFEALPLAAILSTFYGRFLCLHGGISRDIASVADIERLDRFVEPPMSGPLCDVLWADPMKDAAALNVVTSGSEHSDAGGSDLSGADGEGGGDAGAEGGNVGASAFSATEKTEAKKYLVELFEGDFTENTQRQCSYFYGFRALKRFLRKNDILCIIRAHEVQMDGYYRHFDPVLLSESLDTLGVAAAAAAAAPVGEGKEGGPSESTDSDGEPDEPEGKINYAKPKKNKKKKKKKKKKKSKKHGKKSSSPDEVLAAQRRGSVEPLRQKEFPPVITVFSAPDYCQKYGNIGAVLHIGSTVEEFEPLTFSAVENQPEPLHTGESETTLAQKRIESVVPFMPTNFRGMLTACYELLDWIEETGGRGLEGCVEQDEQEVAEEEEAGNKADSTPNGANTSSTSGSKSSMNGGGGGGGGGGGSGRINLAAEQKKAPPPAPAAANRGATKKKTKKKKKDPPPAPAAALRRAAGTGEAKTELMPLPLTPPKKTPPPAPAAAVRSAEKQKQLYKKAAGQDAINEMHPEQVKARFSEAMSFFKQQDSLGAPPDTPSPRAGHAKQTWQTAADTANVHRGAEDAAASTGKPPRHRRKRSHQRTRSLQMSADELVKGVTKLMKHQRRRSSSSLSLSGESL